MMRHLDIGEGFIAVRSAVQRAMSRGNAMIALLLAGLFGIAVAGLAPLVWAFDLRPTIVFGMQLAEYINGSGWADINPIWAGYTIMVLTLLPTCLELLLPMIAQEWPLAKWGFYLLLSFDAVTDSPAVAAALAPYEPDGVAWWLVWYVAHYAALFSATILFEFLLLSFLLGFVMCFFALFGSRRGEAPAHGRH